MKGVYLSTGEVEITGHTLRALGVPADDRAKIAHARRYVYPGSCGRGGYFELAVNGVVCGFVRWNARGRFFWHALVEH